MNQLSKAEQGERTAIHTPQHWSTLADNGERRSMIIPTSFSP
jgi:hypothetical protein